MPEGRTRDEIPPGTLYMLILKMLARHGKLHGYEIANAIQQVSSDVLQVEEGSLTAAGRKQFHAEIEQYRRVSGAIEAILQSN